MKILRFASAALAMGVSLLGVSPASATDVQAANVTQSMPLTTAAVAQSDPNRSGTAEVQPRYIWGLVIKVVTSKPACIAARDFYNKRFPELPKVKCLKMGKVWVVVPR